MIRDNRIHDVLKVLSTGDIYQFEIDQMVSILNASGKKTDRHVVGYVFNILQDNNLLRSIPGTAWIIEGNEGIQRIRQAYAGNLFKEPSDFWKTPLNISSIVGSISTIAALVLAWMSYSQVQTLNKLEGEKKVLLEQATKAQDSLENLLRTKDMETTRLQESLNSSTSWQIKLQSIVNAPEINSCICSYTETGHYDIILMAGSENETQFCYIQVDNQLNRLLLVKAIAGVDPNNYTNEYENENFRVILEVKYDKPYGYDSYLNKATLRVKSKVVSQELKIETSGTCAC